MPRSGFTRGPPSSAASDVGGDEGNLPKQWEQLSRWLARFLRHEAQVTDDGWFRMSDLMVHDSMKRYSVQDVQLVVQKSCRGTRPRFEIQDGYIRAAPKHSRWGNDCRPPPRQQAKFPQQWQQQPQSPPKPKPKPPSANSISSPKPRPPTLVPPKANTPVQTFGGAGVPPDAGVTADPWRTSDPWSEACGAREPKRGPKPCPPGICLPGMAKPPSKPRPPGFAEPPQQCLPVPSKAADPLALADPWAKSAAERHLPGPKPRPPVVVQEAATLPPAPVPPPSKRGSSGLQPAGDVPQATAGLLPSGSSCDRRSGQPPAQEFSDRPIAVMAASSSQQAARAKPKPPDLILPGNPVGVPKESPQQAAAKLPECFTMTTLDTPRVDSEQEADDETPGASPYRQLVSRASSPRSVEPASQGAHRTSARDLGTPFESAVSSPSGEISRHGYALVLHDERDPEASTRGGADGEAAAAALLGPTAVTEVAPAMAAGAAPLAAQEAAAAEQQEADAGILPLEPGAWMADDREAAVQGDLVPEEDRVRAATPDLPSPPVSGALAAGGATTGHSSAGAAAGGQPGSHGARSHRVSDLGRLWYRYEIPEGGYWWCAEGPGGEVLDFFLERTCEVWRPFIDPDNGKVFWWSEAEWFYAN